MVIKAAKIFSTLGNSNSLIPLAVKDMSGIAGMTAGSYATGKEEGKDRFIDEIGTSLIWLLGIPSLKWLYDNTFFKVLGLDAKFDPRNFKDKEVLEKIKQYSPDEKVKKSIEKAIKNEKLFKNTAFGRFVFSTVITIVGYIMLTKYKQKYTEEQIKKNLINEHNKKNANKEQNKKDAVQYAEKTNLANEEITNPTFKGVGSAIEYFAFSPVKNMLILEGAITATRLKDSRSPQEFTGYAIKEAAAWTFLYFAGEKIQNSVEKHAKDKYNKSIGLDARVLEGGELKQAFDNGTIEKCLKEFNAAKTSNAELYEFLHKNPENMIVKAAKKTAAKGSGNLIETYKGTNKIDTRKYIDLEDVKGVESTIRELYGQYKDALKKGETSEKFFAGVKKLKRQSIMANIGSCALVLGVITPGIMLAKRFLSKDDTEFQTKKDIREQLINEGVIA